MRVYVSGVNRENLPWRALTWILGGVITAPALYFLSWGFANYFEVRFDLTHQNDVGAVSRHHAALKRIYEPFILHTPTPISQAFIRYGDWWAELASRHDESSKNR